MCPCVCLFAEFNYNIFKRNQKFVYLFTPCLMLLYRVALPELCFLPCLVFVVVFSSFSVNQFELFTRTHTRTSRSTWFSHTHKQQTYYPFTLHARASFANCTNCLFIFFCKWRSIYVLFFVFYLKSLNQKVCTTLNLFYYCFLSKNLTKFKTSRKYSFSRFILCNFFCYTVFACLLAFSAYKSHKNNLKQLSFLLVVFFVAGGELPQMP